MPDLLELEALRTEFASIAPGSIEHIPGVIDPEIAQAAGRRVLNGGVSWEPIGGNNWDTVEWIPRTGYDMPDFLQDVIEPLELALPFSAERELSRVRHYTAEQQAPIHTDSAEDFRIIAVLLGTDIVEWYETYTKLVARFTANPGDVIVVNNMVRELARAQDDDPAVFKPKHKAYGPVERVIEVVGYEPKR